MSPFAAPSCALRPSVTWRQLTERGWPRSLLSLWQRSAARSLLAGHGRGPFIASSRPTTPRRQWLPEDSWAGEAQLWEGICDSCKVILTPGEACHAPAPGYFRLCFAWCARQALEAAVGRLVRHLRALR